MGRHEGLDPSKVIAIRNGVDAERFDVTSEKVFGSLALKRTFENGCETTDYVKYRQDLKRKLFEKGLIADAEKPLVLYVGRYAKEKGIDILVKMATQVQSQGAQCVTIGVDFGQDSYLKQLQKMQAGSHKGCLKVYTTFKEQDAPFFDFTTPDGIKQTITVKQAIQAAADIRLVPSHHEPCGLVAMEAQCSGAFLVAPYIEGLRDICLPMQGDRLQKEENAVCYQDSHDAKQAKAALEKAVTLWTTMSHEERNQLARRLHNRAIPSYSWYHKDSKTQVVTGAALDYHKVYSELAAGRSAPTTMPFQPSGAMSPLFNACYKVYLLARKCGFCFGLAAFKRILKLKHKKT
jgi:glycogen synthase